MKTAIETFKADPDGVQKNVGALRGGLAQSSTPMPGEEISPEIIEQVAQRLTNEIDMFRGEIKAAPKFPQTGIFEQVWRAWLRTNERI